MKVTAELLARGQTQFQVFCSPCHGRTGRGDGMIVQRGFKKPSSYHVDRLRQMPIGYFYDVMTNGFGAMSDYSAQVPPADRWAIAAYVRSAAATASTPPPRTCRRTSTPSSTRAWPRRRRRSTTDEPALEHRPDSRRSPSPALERLQKTGLAVGGLFLLALAAGFAMDRGQFFRSYLFGFLFWVGIGVGSLGLAMLNHLTGGLWGLVPRRFHEAAARTLPAMALLFVPVVLGASSLYTWAQPEVVAADELLQKKAVYLNVPFFAARAVFYFAVWGLLALAAQLLVAPAGRRRRPRARRAAARPVRGRPRAPVPHHHLRRGGLGHVARPALVLHHLRRPLHRGLDALRPLLHHRADVAPRRRGALHAGPSSR